MPRINSWVRDCVVGFDVNIPCQLWFTLLIVSMTSTVLYSCRLIPWHLLNRRVCMSELQIDFLWQWVEIQFCNLKQSTIIWFVYNMRFISNTWNIMRDLLVCKMRKIMTEEFLIRLAANLLIIGRNGANSKFFLRTPYLEFQRHWDDKWLMSLWLCKMISSFKDQERCVLTLESRHLCSRWTNWWSTRLNWIMKKNDSNNRSLSCRIGKWRAPLRCLFFI